MLEEKETRKNIYLGDLAQKNNYKVSNEISDFA